METEVHHGTYMREIILTADSDVIKCLKQIKLSIQLYKCALYSELSSKMSYSMIHIVLNSRNKWP